MDGGGHWRNARRITRRQSAGRIRRTGSTMGMQFMGRMGHDRKVLEFAMAYEAATDYLDQRPVLTESI